MHAIARRQTYLGRIIGKFGTLSANAQGGRPQHCHSILLTTMPKSGSAYVSISLSKILNLPTLRLCNSYGLIDQMGVQDAKVLIGGGVAQVHLAPSPENLQILQYFKLKMVLHIRDPRQALLSWIYHLDWASNCDNESEALLYFVPPPPSGYFQYTLARKIDWQIENYLPQLVAWVARWVEVADEGSIPILITHQDNLRTNEKAFFDSILAHYGIDRCYMLPNLPRTLEETHFRRADPIEWMRTFTPDQAERATAMIPVSLSARFDWG